MKRILALVLLLCLALSACTPNQGGEVTTNQTENGTTVETTEETTVETTEEVVMYQHPLTGEFSSELYTDRPTAVVINNVKACLPQSGISSANMIYEFEVEGSSTRLLAIFSDFTGVESIGPVRSDRTYFNNISAAYDIPVIHCGGSDKALAGMYDDTNKLSGWEHINESANPKYFYRDASRKGKYRREHTLFTTGEKLIEALADKGMNTVYETGVNYGLVFMEEPVLMGESANTVTVKFRAGKNTKLTYDEQTGVYKAYQLNQDHIDAGTGEQMAYRNVLVLQARQWNSGKKARAYYDLIGEGEGFFACDGQMVPIKWSREDVNGIFTYTFADGTPLTLGIGKTYVGVISDTKGTVTCE